MSWFLLDMANYKRKKPKQQGKVPLRAKWTAPKWWTKLRRNFRDRWYDERT